MPDPKTALFQRKGATPSNQGPGDTSGPPAETGQDGAPEMTMCPNCGCQFDPDNPEDYIPPAGGAEMAGAPPSGPPMGGGPGGGASEIAGLLGIG